MAATGAKTVTAAGANVAEQGLLARPVDEVVVSLVPVLLEEGRPHGHIIEFTYPLTRVRQQTHTRREEAMQLTIFGASGGTGRRLVEQALAAGHTVTAVVRDPARLPVRHDRLKLVAADVLDPEAITPAVADADAVLSALGPRSSRNRSSITSAGTASILKAMRTADSSRLGGRQRRPRG